MELTKESSASSSALELLDAPDDSIGDSQKEQVIGHSLQLNLPRRVVDDMVKCSNLGKPVQVSFGSAPLLRFGDDSCSLRLSPSGFRRELYIDKAGDAQRLHFDSLISHHAVLAEAKEATKGSEDALATLQASLAQYKKEKEDNSATFIRGETETGRATKRAGAGNNSKVNNNKPWRKPALFQNFPRSGPSSPSLLPHSKLSSLPNSHPQHSSLVPTSAPTQPQSASHTASKIQAQRFVLFHFLALGPASENSIAKATGISKEDLATLLEKFAQQSPSADQHQWELRDRWFKELQVWTFNYPSPQSRQTAIDNAIRAFDRQRVSKDDKLWQSLLPKEKRGKGIVLSKLNLATSNNPSTKPPVQRDEQESLDRKHTTAPSEETMAPAKAASKGQAQPATKTAPKKSGKSEATSAKSDVEAPTKKRKLNASLEKPTNFGDPDEGSDDLDAVLSAVNHSEPDTKTKRSKTGHAAKYEKTGSKQNTRASAKVKSDEFVHDSDDIDDGLEDEARPKKKVKTSQQAPKPEEKKATKRTVASRSASAAPSKTAGEAAKNDVLDKSSKRSDKTEAASRGKKPDAQASAPAPASEPKGDAGKSMPANPLKRSSPEDRHEAESPSKKTRSNGQAANRQGSSSSPQANASDYKKSAQVGAKMASKPSASAGEETKSSNVSNGQSKVRLTNGSSNGTQEKMSPPKSGVKSTPGEGDREVKITLNELLQEYKRRFKDHITMHLAFDKLPAGSKRDDTRYRENHRELQSLTGTIKFFMRRLGKDDSKFTQIPKDFAMSSVPGLKDFVEGKLAGLKAAFDKKKDQAKSANATPETKKRVAEILAEINDLEALRKH